MKKTTLLFTSVFSVLTSFAAQASEIYKISPEKFSLSSRSFSEQGVEIEDSIPQLGIVILKNSPTKSAGWTHLGSSQKIHLIKPLASAPKRLWGLQSIAVDEAWTQSQGEGVVVAVSDTGIDSDHPDLIENMWVNPREFVNGVDDDGNGYIDDVHGWDFVKKLGSGVDHHYHGTHVAGTIGARIGDKMAGVAPKVKLMDVSFLDAGGSGSDVDGAKTIIYAADNGAKIVNCSWGAPERIPLIEEAVLYAQKKGVLVVAAAGNAKTNTDRKPHTPSSLDPENIVSIGSIASKNGWKSDFSNYGLKTVDLAAPGTAIYSTAPSGKSAKYQTLSGTSMASPHAAGVAALIWSKYPYMNWKDVKTQMMSSTVPSKSWVKSSVSGGLLNAANAVR